ncbi:MAG: Nucleolar protein 12 [Sporothrix epigloea]
MAPRKSVFAAPKKAVDPLLDALFSSSVKPAETSTKPKYEPLVVSKPRAPIAAPVKPLTREEKDAVTSDNDGSDVDNGEEEDDDTGGNNEIDKEVQGESSAANAKVPVAPVDLTNGASKRKRKTRDENEDLESRYFDKLEKEVGGPAGKKAKRVASDSNAETHEVTMEEEGSEADEPIVHESLFETLNGEDTAGDVAEGTLNEEDKAKADRTVFLSNVSISAITDKAAKKTLMAHLESIFDEEPAKSVTGKKNNEKADQEPRGEDEAVQEDGKKKKTSVLESLRFRSTPFASAALPKRASFITKAVMGATAQSTNAYAIYTTPAAARAAVRKLNGTIVLDRYLRADSVTHPMPVDHRRCVFVGNLGFVDDETVLSANPEADGENGGGEMTRKKRIKTPMDVEEGLWRAFTKHAGKVESVRVIRDQVTRVGKGIAYVQFYDSTSVEAALLMADKKFPPLLPRALRVSRCKAPHKTARALERAQQKASGKVRSEGLRGKREGRDRRQSSASSSITGYKPKLTAEQQTSAGRASKLLGKSAATTPLDVAGPDGKPMVFEGMRARVGGVNLFKKGKGGKKSDAGGRSGGPQGKATASRKQARQASRAAQWRAKKSGGT